MFDNERQSVFLLRLGSKQGCLFLNPTVNTVLDVLGSVISQEKEIKPSDLEGKIQNYFYSQMT